MSGSSSFPPPTAGGAPPAPPLPPPGSGHEVAVVPAAPPRRRTGRIVAGVLAVLALVVGVVAIVVARAGDDGAERSLDAALAQASSAESAAYTAVVEIDGDQLMAIDAVVDQASERTRLDAQLTLAGVLGDEGEASMSIITDGASDSVYLDADGLLPFVPGGWIRLDIAQLSELTGQDLGDLSTQFGVSPLDTAALLAEGDAVEVGPTEIDGEDVTQYQVTIDTRDLMSTAPGLGEQLDQLEQLGGGVPDEITYDVFVADGNELRRVVLAVDVAGVALRTVVDVEQLGGAVDIPLPDDVTDLGELGGLLDGLGDGLLGD